MKTKGIVLSLMASTLINIQTGFASEYKKSTQLTESKKSKLEFYPVKLSKTNLKEGLFLNGKNYLQLTDKPILTLEDFQFKTLTDNVLGVKLQLNKKDSKKLEDISKKYINTKLAVLYNNKILEIPDVKNIVSEEGLKVKVKSENAFLDLLTDLKDA